MASYVYMTKAFNLASDHASHANQNPKSDMSSDRWLQGCRYHFFGIVIRDSASHYSIDWRKRNYFAETASANIVRLTHRHLPIPGPRTELVMFRMRIRDHTRKFHIATYSCLFANDRSGALPGAETAVLTFILFSESSAVPIADQSHLLLQHFVKTSNPSTHSMN
ncbi:hypothetical protein BDQ17DRAFT_621804 [Cyathus striatus]|nr:hypothetical protein BDQ17DRAFT_621804 [Cyathus striatus]